MEIKEQVLKMKNSGASYGNISKALGISINTVKSIVSRSKKETTRCLNCGVIIKSLPKHRKKKFCSDKCRMEYWINNNKSQKEGKCKYCNKIIYYYASKHRSFCSRACYLNSIKGESNGR